MVRTYHRKKEKPAYSRETLQQAVEDVRSKGLSGYEAARLYHIPRKTIMDHVSGRRGQKSSTYGRPTALPPETEKRLADCLHIMEKWGFGLSRNEVIQLVGDFVKTNKLNTPFTDGIPGNDWCSNFMQRYGLSIKKPQAVEIARKKAADPFILQEYFDILEKTIKDLGLEDKPERIYNVDETSYCSDPKKTKVVGLKGYPSTRTTATSGKGNTTVLFASNAAGGKGPPFIIFKGKHVWSGWTSDEAYPGTLYTATSNGWIESEAFCEYITESFIPMIEDTSQPTLLIYDGHSTHLQLSVVEKALENNITIIKLPAHTSHLLQPLDLSVFKPFKDAWDQEMVKWQRKNKGDKLPKNEFSALIGKVWKNLDPSIIQNGFKKGGIYPFNRDVVPEHKLNPETIKRWKKWKETRETRESPMTLTELCLRKINGCEQSTSNTRITTENVPQNKSFEDLLLDSMNKHQNNNLKKKNIRVSASAEVITHQEVIKRLKHKEDEKIKKEIERDERRKRIEDNKKLKLKKQNATNAKDGKIKREKDCKNIKLNTSNPQKLPLLPIDSNTLLVSHMNLSSPCDVASNSKRPSTDLDHASTSKRQKICIIEDRILTEKEKVPKKGKNKMKSKNESKILKKRKQNKIKKEEEDLSANSDYSIRDSDQSDVSNVEKYFKTYLQDYNTDDEENLNISFGISDIVYFEDATDKLKVEDWVLVKFLTKKSEKYYVGQIIDLSNGIPTIKYLRKTPTKQNQLLFVYPTVEDICELKHVEDVVSILPKPTISRRGQISFAINFDKLNVQ